jgi:hypothetical protein
MKTAIYIEDGAVQLVITPETEFEKNALSTMRNKTVEAELFDGSFYDCRGGWVRQTAHYNHGKIDNGHANDKSLIIRVQEAEKHGNNGSL